MSKNVYPKRNKGPDLTPLLIVDHLLRLIRQGQPQADFAKE